MCEIVNSLVGPIVSSAMPRHELILHIAVALCSRPSGTGCRVLLECDQFKTVMLKVSYNFFLLWQRFISVLPQCECMSALLGEIKAFSSAQSTQGSLQRLQEWGHGKIFLTLEVGSLQRLLYAHSKKECTTSKTTYGSWYVYTIYYYYME